jgi:hypothetical protein
MQKDRSNWPIKKVSFAEAEEIDIEYYASIDWKESARIVEEMRMRFWNEGYPGKVEMIIRKKSLKDSDDDFE